MFKKSLIIVLILSVSGLFAQDVFTEKMLEAKTKLHHGFDTWNADEMHESAALFNRLLTLDKETWLVHYYSGLAGYRLGIYYMESDKKQARAQFNEAIDHLKKCASLNDTFPESYALISSCLGNKIGLTPWKAMFLGPKSGSEMEKALEFDSKNPRVWLLMGLGSYHSPKSFGGGKEKAAEELKQAIQYFESESVENPLYPSWGYDQAYGWLGMAQTDLGEFDAAQESLNKGLKNNPQSGWIRYELIPNLEKKMNEK